MRRSPPDHTLWFSLGNCYLTAHLYGRAVESYTAALSLRGDFVLGWEYRGIARMLVHQHVGAVQDFNMALEYDPTSQTALVNRALALFALSDEDRAVGGTEAVDGRVLIGGKSLSPPATLRQAVADLTQALELGCTQTRIYFIRAQIRTRLGDEVGARQDVREGLSRQPRDELSCIVRGIARLNGDTQGALADFYRALNWNPRSILAWQNISHVLAERLDRLPAAVDALDHLLSVDPSNAPALAGRGVLRARLGQDEASHRDAEAALAASTEPLLRYQVACIYALTAARHSADRRRAIELIAGSLRDDASIVDVASRDSDLAHVRDDPQLQAVLSAARTIQQAAGR